VTLQDLIFDNRVLWNHRALAAVFGVVLNLPPIKQTMASQQVKSRYLERDVDTRAQIGRVDVGEAAKPAGSHGVEGARGRSFNGSLKIL
jgi:hypothetical protein